MDKLTSTKDLADAIQVHSFSSELPNPALALIEEDRKQVAQIALDTIRRLQADEKWRLGSPFANCLIDEIKSDLRKVGIELE